MRRQPKKTPVSGSPRSASAATSIQLVNRTRAAELLAISERKLWELSNRGEIRHLRIGRAVRYDVADLVTWIEERKEGGGT